jgi:hypothetical protein
MRLSGEGTPKFDTLDNPLNRPSISFENESEDIHVPRLGSQDLISIANFARSRGYEVQDFEIVDGTMTRVSSSERERVSRRIKEALNGSSIETATALFIDTYPTYSILGISLRDKENNRSVLRRNGVLEAESRLTFVQFVSAAWNQLKFA